jgi:hypothetical protein
LALQESRFRGEIKPNKRINTGKQEAGLMPRFLFFGHAARYASHAIMRFLSDGVTCNMTAWLLVRLQSDD